MTKAEAMRCLKKGIALRENGKFNGVKIFLDDKGKLCQQRPDGYVFTISDPEHFNFRKFKPSGGM